MITSRRDYILRIIDEVGRLLARVIFKRRNRQPEEALQVLVQACERLFALEADKLFQFTPDQHFTMLTQDEPPEIARNKVLLYAALNAEAGQIYGELGNAGMSRASFLNALRFTLRARAAYGTENLPEFTPSLAILRDNLAGVPLDAETSEQLKQAGV
jgi:hypothetical protein